MVLEVILLVPLQPALASIEIAKEQLIDLPVKQF
jgi:hypothetical protein